MLLKNTVSILCLCFLLLSCQNNKSVEIEENSQFKREVEQGLVLFNSTLEQSNEKGKILWRLKTEKAVYSPDKKTAKLDKLTANLFSDDVLILQLSADKGELRNDGKEIYLQENIIVVDPRNKAEFKGDEVVWYPEENTMTMTGKERVKANHSKLTVEAFKAKYNTQNQVLELEKDIIATTKNPSLQLQTQSLSWQIEKNKVIGNEKLNLIRYEDKIITDRLKTDKIQVDLTKNIAVIDGNVEYESFKPILQAATQQVTWYYQERRMESKTMVTVRQPKEGTTLTANQGRFDLEINRVNLEGGIYGKTDKNQAQIYADNLTWNLNNQQIDAVGNIYYEQIEPNLNVTGKTASGNLREKNIVVKSGREDRVITTIYNN